MSSSADTLSSSDGDSSVDIQLLDMSNTLEDFVLSPNRRKLLQIENENDTKEDESMEDEQQSSIIYGSHQHLYFHLLQIENEITNILLNNDINNLSSSNINEIKSLLNEANNVITKYEKKKRSVEDINIMSFRHKLRKLFLSPYIKMDQQETKQGGEEEEDIFDILIDKLGVEFDHTKPNDIITNNDGNEEEQKISSIMDEFDVNDHFDKLFAQCGEKNHIQEFSTFCILCFLFILVILE